VAAPEPAAPQPASAPTTSGIAPPRQLPATQVTERSPTPALPSAATVPVSKPADAGAADHPARPAEHVKKKHPRKDLAKRNKRKLEWYEDERAVAERQNYGSYGNRNRGLFGIFP
jgi:hypothetical protein